MSLFRKHQKEEERMPQYNYSIPPIKFRDDFFLSLDNLTSQAEFHFKNKNYELSEGIFELMIKHIEKNKSIRLVEEQDLISKIITEKRKGKINDEFPTDRAIAQSKEERYKDAVEEKNKQNSGL